MNDRANILGVLLLGMLSGGSLLGAVYLASLGKEIPPFLPTIGAACAGAIAGLLKPPSGQP